MIVPKRNATVLPDEPGAQASRAFLFCGVEILHSIQGELLQFVSTIAHAFLDVIFDWCAAEDGSLEISHRCCL
jgi:hypothetical protein